MPAKRKMSKKPTQKFLRLTTVDAVIEKLGDEPGVRALTGRTQQNVTNWRAIGLFPSNTFLVMDRVLKQKGFYAPPKLWRMIEPTRSDTSWDRSMIEW